MKKWEEVNDGNRDKKNNCTQHKRNINIPTLMYLHVYTY